MCPATPSADFALCLWLPGIGCSTVGTALLPITSHLRLPMVDTSALSPALSSQPHNFVARVSPSSTLRVYLTADIAKHFGLRALGALTEHAEWSIELVNNMNGLVVARNMTLCSSVVLQAIESPKVHEPGSRS